MFQKFLPGIQSDTLLKPVEKLLKPTSFGWYVLELDAANFTTYIRANPDGEW